MMNAISGLEVPWSLAETVHRQTEGNPLFVQEVLRYLRESGIVTGDYGRWRPTDQTAVEMSIPEGLRDVIGKRLSLLSPECNRLLSVAAVIGREFRLEVLQKVAGVTEAELFAILREAKGAAAVEERSTVGAAVTYRFTHAFFCQTLSEEMIAPERIRMHQQVAQALEGVYATRLEEHATELAEHFSYYSDPADLAKAVTYCEMAARRAMSVYAYGEAVRLLEQAIKVQALVDPEDKEKRCDLLTALCEALGWAGEPRRILDVEAPEALSLAEAIGDNRRAFRVCLYAMSATAGYQSVLAPASPEYAQWVERADRYAEPGTAERVRADINLGAVKYGTGHPEEGALHLNRALDLARRLGDPWLFWGAANNWLGSVTAPQHTKDRVQLAEELVTGARPTVSTLMLGRRVDASSSTIAYTFLELGQRQRAEEIFKQTKDMFERSGVAYQLLYAMEWEAIMATMDGRLEEAVDISRRILAKGEELGIREFAVVRTVTIGIRPRIHLGRADRALQLNVELSPEPNTKLLCLANLGRNAEVAEILAERVLARPGIGSAEDETLAFEDIISLEAAVLVGHREAADLLLRRLSGSGVHTNGRYFTTCTTRYLGAAAALVDRPDEARSHYQEAIKVTTEMPFRPELALTRLQLAELLLEHYPDEKPEALEHLDFAINEFRDMKMQPSLERALKHKDILKA